MTLAELLANEELRQHEFPVTREKVFLAHAGDCPLPRRVAEAITQYTLGATTGDQRKLFELFQRRQHELRWKLELRRNLGDGLVSWNADYDVNRRPIPCGVISLFD